MFKRIGLITATTLMAYAAPVAALVDDNANHAQAEAFMFDHVSCNGAENEIRIIIDGVKGSHGLITADLYPNKEEGFLKGKARLKQVKFAARAPQTKFCVRAPESGMFAIAVYHDENANGRFDKTGIGFPAEPWGLSNNPKVRFGPPKVEKTIFEVQQGDGAKIKIDLN